MIPHSRPSVGPEERLAIDSALGALALADGPEIARFEEGLARWIGVRYAVATSSGSSALHLALLAAGVGSGDEVIVPSYTCAALPSAIHSVGARAVLVDISREDLNLTVETIRPKLSARTKAIIVTHTHGVPADMPEIKKLGVAIVEDLAQCMGAGCQLIKVGNWGDIAICSFYATKLMTSIDGGMVLTNDQDWAGTARDLRYYGGKLGYKHRFNYKMTNLAAAVGLAQLAKLDHFLAVRASIAETYDGVLRQSGLSAFPSSLPGRRRVYYRYCVALPRRDQFLASMRERGVQCGRGLLQPLHRAFGNPDSEYPNSSFTADALASIPLYPSLSADEVANISHAMSDCLGELSTAMSVSAPQSAAQAPGRAGDIRGLDAMNIIHGLESRK